MQALVAAVIDMQPVAVGNRLTHRPDHAAAVLAQGRIRQRRTAVGSPPVDPVARRSPLQIDSLGVIVIDRQRGHVSTGDLQRAKFQELRVPRIPPVGSHHEPGGGTPA